MFDCVAIAGLGLIGGSLGMALRRRGLARRVVGIARRAATLEKALDRGAIDAGSVAPAAAAEAELVVFAAPVLAIPPLCEALAPHLRSGALLTDVGSTKSLLMRRLEELAPPGVDLVGGHPMAGSERGGVGAARAELFEGAVYVLTRAARTRDDSMARLAELARRLGAVPVEMDAALHDRAVAVVSHVPHVAAAALAQAVSEAGVPREVLRLLVAGGYRSTTRIASSPPELWRDVCLTNREPILEGLARCEAALGRFRAALEAGDGEALLDAFAAARAARDSLAPPESGGR